MSVTRPKIFEPTIRLYDRPIHPEFFRIVASKTIRREFYEVVLGITSVGHVVCWTGGGRMLTEVVVANRCELPRTDFLQTLSESRPSLLTLPDRLYSNRSQIDEVSPEFFGDFDKEFFQDARPSGVLYRFGFSGRVALGGIGYIGVESRSRQLKIRAIHTFPDDSILLKTESVIRFDNP